jgi:hypothetical protein
MHRELKIRKRMRRCALLRRPLWTVATALQYLGCCAGKSTARLDQLVQIYEARAADAAIVTPTEPIRHDELEGRSGG